MSEWIISTSSGKVRGYEREERVEFLGIPYAEAPVGPRRLKRSVAKEAWDGIFDAKVYGASPVQLNQGKVIGDEDCLTVNIKRPLTG
ncbi:MAG: carboxylesterase family protein, partial [Lachnospiraceae bacterium]|nr:carboxylesterase family protein [Lachnospiraceae bacterium]